MYVPWSRFFAQSPLREVDRNRRPSRPTPPTYADESTDGHDDDDDDLDDDLQDSDFDAGPRGAGLNRKVVRQRCVNAYQHQIETHAFANVIRLHLVSNST